MRRTLGFSLLASSFCLTSLLEPAYASYGNYPCGSPLGLSVQMVPGKQTRFFPSGNVSSPLANPRSFPLDQSKCVGSTNMGSGGQCVRISNDDFACGVQGSLFSVISPDPFGVCSLIPLALGCTGAICITDDGCDGGQCAGMFPGSSW